MREFLRAIGGLTWGILVAFGLAALVAIVWLGLRWFAVTGEAP